MHVAKWGKPKKYIKVIALFLLTCSWVADPLIKNFKWQKWQTNFQLWPGNLWPVDLLDDKPANTS
jgi:hypothetical protein